MSRLFCIGVLVAFCLASPGFAKESALLLSDGDAGAAPAPKSKRSEALKLYQERIDDVEGAIDTFNRVIKYCETIDATVNSAGGSEPMVTTYLNGAKAIADRYPRSEKMKKAIARVTPYVEAAAKLMETARKIEKKVCPVVDEMRTQKTELFNQKRVLTNATNFLKKASVKDDDVDAITQRAAPAVQQIEKIIKLFQDNSKAANKYYSAAEAAAHTVVELAAEAEEEKKNVEKAAENLLPSGEDKPDEPIIVDAPKEKPETVNNNSTSRPPAATVTNTLPAESDATKKPAQPDAAKPSLNNATPTVANTLPAEADATKKPAQPDADTADQPETQPNSLPNGLKNRAGDALGRDSDSASGWGLSRTYSPLLLLLFFVF